VHDSGSVTLTDEKGATYTVEDVLYVPEDSQPIISLMKIRKHGFDFHFLGGHDVGDFLLSLSSSHIEFVGHAVDNILYIKERSSTLQSFAVTTRSVNKRPFSDLQSSENNGRVIENSSAITPSPKSPAKISACDPPNLWHLHLGHA
jgi:hypothetical protein